MAITSARSGRMRDKTRAENIGRKSPRQPGRKSAEAGEVQGEKKEEGTVSRSNKRALTLAAIIFLIAVSLGLFLFAHRSRPSASKVASNEPGVSTNDKSIAVLPFVDL